MSGSRVEELYGELGLCWRMLRSVRKMASHSAGSRDGDVVVEEGRMPEQRGLLPLDLELRRRRTLLWQSIKGLGAHSHSSATPTLAERSLPGHSTVTAATKG